MNQRNPETGSLDRWLPALQWLGSYDRTWFRFDAIAGLTAAAVVVPQAMAYGSIAGVPLVVGLYTALVPLLVYAVMGTSRPLSVTTTSTIAILTAHAVREVAPGGTEASLIVATGALACLVGGMLLVASLLRLGVVASFISEPLIVKTEGMVHFANAQRIGELIWPLIAQHKPRVLLLDCSAIPDLEYTALKMLTEAERRMQQSGISLWLAGLNPEPLQLIQNSTLGKRLGRAGMYFNVDKAVRSFLKQSEEL